MRVTIFLIFLFGLCACATVPRGACVGNRDALLECFDQLVDTNHDGNITTAELDAAFVAYASVFPTYPGFTENYNTSYIMNVCDADGDGVITTSVDWVHANACLTMYPIINYVCRLCYIAGFIPNK